MIIVDNWEGSPHFSPREKIMMRFLERCRYTLAGITLMLAGNAFSQEKDQAVLWPPRHLASGEVPLPDRIARSDIVVLGRVVAMEPKDVEAVLSLAHPYRLDYRIAVVKVAEVIHGPKDVKQLRLGFVSPDQNRAVDKTGKNMPSLGQADFRSVKEGQDGLFFLRKHHQSDFYVNTMLIGGFLPSGAAPEFAKNLEIARRLSKVLEFPLEALKADNASNRFLAATMLINRYRLDGIKASKLPEKGIDAEESKLLLKTLAEAEWKDVKEAITINNMYPPHPYRVFLQLGVTKADGYDPPKMLPTFGTHSSTRRVGFGTIRRNIASCAFGQKKEVIEGKIKAQRREIAYFTKELHVRFIRIEGAAERGEAFAL